MLLHVLWIVYGLWLNTTKNKEYEFYSCHVYFENQPIWRRLQKSNILMRIKVLL
jgi:hypothetical protein